MLRRWRYLPSAAKVPVWRIAFAPLDLADALSGASGSRPPRWLRYLVGDNFEAVGQEFLGHFRQIALLAPHEAVLDVGCGSGRMAVPLATYLEPPGRYEGFDIVPAAVRWCAEHITPRHPHFRFRLLDVRNGRYNPRGKVLARDVRFPYDDATFDLAIATSVFTHLDAAACQRYLRESRRVLRPGARLMATFFLVDDAAARLLAEASSSLDFVPGADGAYTLRNRLGDTHFAVAYEEDRVRAWLRDAGLVLAEPIRRGNWCGRSQAVSFQDIVLARLEP